MVRTRFQLDAMSVAELRQLRDQIQTALSGKIQMERDQLQKSLMSSPIWKAAGLQLRNP